MGKKFFILLFLFLSPAFSSFAAQYEMNLSTYYPSPFGSYESLYLKPKSQPLGTPCKVGTLYFDPDGKLQVCQSNKMDIGVWIQDNLWREEMNNIYLDETALNPDIFVGIGTKTPEFKLTLEGDGGILSKGEFGNGAVLSTTGSGTRLIWYPRKGAFRSGRVDSTQWNDGNIGDYSLGAGFNSTADKTGSTAMGFQTNAIGLYATAMGYQTIASGESSVAMGNQSIASGNASAAFGYKTFASGFSSFASGYETIASGDVSFASGYKSVASGEASLALGGETLASGDNSVAVGRKTKADGNNALAAGIETIALGTNSVAMGYQSEANGENSTALGNSFANGEDSFSIGTGCIANGPYSTAMGTLAIAEGENTVAIGMGITAQAYNSLVIGVFNIIEGDKTNWVDTDALFVIGNGTSDASRSNALTILKNGKVGIGTNSPTASLSAKGISEYVDNAAAVAAGLQAGDFYRTGDSLKVVH